MAHLFRDLTLGNSKRESTPPPPSPPPSIIPVRPVIAAADLPSPFGQLASQLTDSDLRLTAFEIFVAVCRTSSGKHLTYASSANQHAESFNHQHSPSSPGLQRSLTSTAASKVKKALGLKSPGSGSKKSPGSGSSQGKSRRPLTVGELMRIQMGVSETVDSRVRRALLRISAGQVFVQFSSFMSNSISFDHLVHMFSVFMAGRKVCWYWRSPLFSLSFSYSFLFHFL